MTSTEKLAEGVGFEPTVRLRARRFSRPVYSTTLAPLQGSMVCNRTGCRDNKCQGFGQEEPVRLTRAYALLPSNDAELRTRFCTVSCRGLGASRACSRSLSVGHRHDSWRELDREAPYPTEFVKTIGEKLMGGWQDTDAGPIARRLRRLHSFPAAARQQIVNVNPL
jgi:hypothetical protein